jgi:hypothetical protein
MTTAPPPPQFSAATQSDFLGVHRRRQGDFLRLPRRVPSMRDMMQENSYTTPTDKKQKQHSRESKDISSGPAKTNPGSSRILKKAHQSLEDNGFHPLEGLKATSSMEIIWRYSISQTSSVSSISCSSGISSGTTISPTCKRKSERPSSSSHLPRSRWCH